MRRIPALIFILLFFASCNLPQQSNNQALPSGTEQVNSAQFFLQTPLPTRTTYKPGELVDYTAQSGDTLPALAARFNTTIDEILEANPQVPRAATTMPPGMPMKIPIYYMALWITPFQFLPDQSYVNGPASIGFSTAA